jgi:tetratricopeptide (TPR) repeat protein
MRGHVPGAAFIVAWCCLNPQLHGQSTVDQRIVFLRGWGAIHVGDNDRPRTSVGINLVAPSVKRDGNRVWLTSTGGDETGWADAADVLPLAQALAYFDRLLEQNPSDWDALLRRAESKHALNQREAAMADYTRAIELNPAEAFLYLRRGRHFMARRICDRALRDFEEAIRLVPTSARQDYNLTAELLSLQSGIYSGCADLASRDPRQAVATALRAVELDPSRPALLTILAAAYASSSDFAKAVDAQRRALDSPRFPPRYREDAVRQLREYQQALVRQ